MGQTFTNPNRARRARELRRELLDRMEDVYPEFKPIRQRYAEGTAAQEALQLGRNLALRPGDRADDLLREFDKMSEPQKDLFRLGVAQQIRDIVGSPSKSDTADLVRTLRQGGVRDIFRRVLGDEPAKKLLRAFDEEAEVTRSSRALTQGSRTAPLQEAQRKLLEEEQLVSDLFSMRPLGLLEGVSRRLARSLADRNNRELVDILTTSSERDIVSALDDIISAERVLRARETLGRTGTAAGAAIGQQTGQEQGR